jgi:tetratricopeptide (TPR) repeat protein
MPISSFVASTRSVARAAAASAAIAALVLAASGCGGGDREPGAPRTVDKRVAAEAEGHASEAAFAAQIRDYPRAEVSMEKAIALRDDVPEGWFSIGLVRNRLGKKDEARTAYRRALALHEDRYDETSATSEIISQVYVLLVLNRESDARKLLEKASRKHPGDARLEEFSRSRGIDRLLADPEVRANQL